MCHGQFLFTLPLFLFALWAAPATLHLPPRQDDLFGDDAAGFACRVLARVTAIVHIGAVSCVHEVLPGLRPLTLRALRELHGLLALSLPAIPWRLRSGVLGVGSE